ncbi:MAG: tetratricopeptide repeat protein, partial [Planctomycetota bacterium]
SCIYPHHPILGSQLWVRYGATIVFVCGILILIKITFFSKHKQQTQILFFFWNFGIVAGPILGWFATSYMQLSRVSDRYNYHSLPFLSLGLALWGAHYLKLLTPLQQRSLTILFLGFLSFLIFCTAQQTQVWSTPISLWIQASKINPQETEVFYNLALSYLSEKKVENAMRAFEETLKIEPRHYKANNNYGNLLAEQGRNEEAIRHLKIAARVHPEEWTAHNNLAHIYHGLGKKEEAIPHYRKSLNNPDRSFVYNVTSLELADILREKAELLKENQNTVFSEAIDCFKMALQGDEKQRAFEGLGLCYLKTDPQKAEECFQKSIQFAKSKNSSSIAWMNLYRLFHGQKQYQKAFQSLESGIQNNPDSIELAQEFLQYSLICPDPNFRSATQAILKFNHFSKILQKDKKILNLLSFVYAENGQIPEAIQILYDLSRSLFYPKNESVSNFINRVNIHYNQIRCGVSILQD